MDFKKAREFVYKNARPIDLARWKYHFEHGTKEDVITLLTSYQNPDGGFGHALEPDYFNPNSSPIQTWRALDLLEEIGFPEPNHPIIQKILAYLASGDGFEVTKNQWCFQVPSNNDYPHAIWWEYHPEKRTFSYNPTAYFAGFMLAFAPKGSDLYMKARQIAQEAYDFLIHAEPLSGDTLRCFIGLYHFLLTSKQTTILPIEAFKKLLIKQIDQEISHDTTKYGIDYVTMPSKIFPTKHALFIEGHEDIIQKEISVLPTLQKEDGGMDIYWKWFSPYQEFEQARLWWRSDLTIRSLRFYQAFNFIK